MADAGSQRLYALLFHPEVAHTDRGTRHPAQLRLRRLRLHRRLDDGVVRGGGDRHGSASRSGTGSVVCGLSGGVDSTVAALLIHRAIGDRLTCIFVDNGVMRQDEAEQIRTALRAAAAAAGVRRRVGAVPRPAGRRHRSGAEAQDHRRDVHRRVRGRRRRSSGSFDFLGAGHALSGRDRERVGRSARRT